MAKFAGRSAILKVGDGVTPTETFTEVPQVGNIEAFGSERDLIDASSYGDDFKDYVLGQQDGSELSLTLQYDPTLATHASLKADYDAATRRNFQIEFPEVTTSFQFTSILRVFTTMPALDGLWEATVTLKIVEPGVTEL